jgi:RNA methyltransferase, TrmH family
MITSRQNPLVKAIRKLHQSKHRHQSQQFLLEGTHLIQEALKVQWPMDILCYTPEWCQKEPLLLQRLQQTIDRVECVSDEVLQAMATTVHPDGVLAVGRSRSGATATPSWGSLHLLLDRIQDPGNLGTLLRTAAATGVDQVWLSPDCVDIENPKVLRASAGAWFQVPSRQCNDVMQHLDWCREQGLQIVATTPRAKQTYWDIDYTQPTVLIMGNEGAGLTDAMLQGADALVQIPIESVESLNVAIATAVILYEAKRQRAIAMAR